MDNNQFLGEILTYISDEYRSFEQYQKIAFEILCEFDRVCRENNIQYYLAYGSLLGAVRDGGQIPWDYDIDVQVSIDDKIKLINVLREKLGNDFYYSYYDNTEKYPAYCLRIGKKGHHFNALHVDVFFLIGCPDDNKEQESFFKALNKYCDLRLKKYSHQWFSFPQNKIDRLIYRALSVRSIFINNSLLDKMEKEIVSKYPYSNAVFCCSLGKDERAYLKKSYSEVLQVEINGKEFFIPKGYSEILDKIYGSWKNYSSASSRFDEFYSMLKIVKQRDQVPFDKEDDNKCKP